ncbi:diguanylate cyclase domain-containing protein [Williamsia sp. MIQD14]|uniref:GGDEF domain-containing protein n=1 Tax=Williamsia sp. MIQD14 TaxID=3425703 RepID=UPI003DA18DCA
MPTPRESRTDGQPARPLSTGAVALGRRWLTGSHDYAWIVEHHSMLPLNLPMRLVLAGNTALIAVCSVLLLMSPQGPHGTNAVIAVAVLVVQAVMIAAVFLAPLPSTNAQARRYFVGFAIFGDVGLTLVLVLYSPLVMAFGCALFVLNGAMCTFFVSSRWVLAHLAWSTAVIGYSGWRVHEARLFDPYANAAGVLVLVTAVCMVPVAAHVAWNVLSIDARQSLIDPLTGLRNRRGVEVALDTLRQRAALSGLALGAVVVDIDDFKRVNDTYGHLAGDDVLRALARRMHDTLGPDTVAGRTGGEEFMIVMCGTPDELAEYIAGLPARLSAADDPVPVTVSVGAAIVTASGVVASPDALDIAIRQADTRMYAAKRAGGDQSSTAML